jgi:predicted ATPase
MIRTIAIQGYRSLRELVLPLGQLSVITGANGSGKSSVYRSLKLLADVAQNAVVASLAREGGLPSTFWAGPETIARSVRQGTHDVEPLAKRKSASLKLGFGSDEYGYSIDLGYPPPPPPATMFGLDPWVKRECIWHGPVYKKSSALVDRRNNFVWLSTTRDEEPVMLTQHLADTDSMLASVADPLRAPEMLAVREGVRGWRFYDHFRTDLTLLHALLKLVPSLRCSIMRGAISRPLLKPFSSCAVTTHSPTPSKTLFPAVGCTSRQSTDASNCDCDSMGSSVHCLQLSFRMEHCATCCGWPLF